MTAEMKAALICREMKWTWQEYGEQPAGFVDTVVSMLEAEAAEAEKRSKTAP